MNVSGYIIASSSWVIQQPGSHVHDFVRILSPHGVVFVLLANASRTGFERVGPDLSSTILDSCSKRLLAEHVHDVTSCFEEASEALRPETNTEDVPSGSLLVVRIQDHTVDAHWIGPDEAWLVRGGGVIARTNGDVLTRPELAEKGIASRVIGTGGDGSPPTGLEAPWAMHTGDRLIVVSWTIIRAASESTIVDCAVIEDAQDAADKLVALAAGSKGEAYAAAAVVIRT